MIFSTWETRIIESVLKGTDADGDDKTSREEYEAKYGTSSGSLIRQSFEDLDRDGDGFIDRDETMMQQKVNLCGVLRGVWPVCLFIGVTTVLAFVRPTVLWEAMA